MEDGYQVVVPFESYKNEVLRFVDYIEEFYSVCTPKNLPEDEYDTNAIGVTFNLNNILHYSSFNASSSFNYDSYTFYYEFSYYFDIPISSSSRKYIYISIPDFLCYDSNSKTDIRVENDTKRNSTDKVVPESGNNTGEIVGIIIAIIALIFFVIMIFICYRRKKEGEYASQEENNSTEIPLSVFYPRVV